MVPSWWHASDAHRLLSVTTLAVFSYYTHYILDEHAGAQLTWRISTSHFSVCTFTTFLCSARDGPASTVASSGLPHIWDPGMLVSLPSGISKPLEKRGAMIVLRDSGLDSALGYMAYCRSRGVEWMWCTSSWFPYVFSVVEVSVVPSHSASLIRRCNVEGGLTGDPILHGCPVLFVPGHLLPLRTIQAQVHRWSSAYHSSVVLGAEVPVEGPGAG